MEIAKVILKNEEGMHARPASEFIKVASKFKCEITVIKNSDESKKYNSKSIFSVLGMAAKKGDMLTITAQGENEAEAVDELKKLVENNFGF